MIPINIHQQAHGRVKRKACASETSIASKKAHTGLEGVEIEEEGVEKERGQAAHLKRVAVSSVQSGVPRVIAQNTQTLNRVCDRFIPWERTRASTDIGIPLFFASTFLARAAAVRAAVEKTAVSNVGETEADVIGITIREQKKREQKSAPYQIALSALRAYRLQNISSIELLLYPKLPSILAKSGELSRVLGRALDELSAAGVQVTCFERVKLGAELVGDAIIAFRHVANRQPLAQGDLDKGAPAFHNQLHNQNQNQMIHECHRFLNRLSADDIGYLDLNDHLVTRQNTPFVKILNELFTFLPWSICDDLMCGYSTPDLKQQVVLGIKRYMALPLAVRERCAVHTFNQKVERIASSLGFMKKCAEVGALR